jgi:hypothetical protein
MEALLILLELSDGSREWVTLLSGDLRRIRAHNREKSSSISIVFAITNTVFNSKRNVIRERRSNGTKHLIQGPFDVYMVCRSLGRSCPQNNDWHHSWPCSLKISSMALDP